ncbi:protein max-like isoform X2 [Homarus americanus]|uniref:protein max-like isoform X2 n=1 Tax=Homarus americanus TaxID=6706 RepID=UPI001C46077D|nr:protein max-like isoform X2 [Homarus americanus]
MSDEERDIDIESDDDESLGGGARGEFQFASQAEKRAHHNALERKRRDHIKDSFCSLRDSVPSLQGEKGFCEVRVMSPPGSSCGLPVDAVSKTSGRPSNDKRCPPASRAQILKKAADYIEFMRRKNSAHQQDIDDLKKQNNLLENQIRSLEKTKYTGNFAAMTSNNALLNSKSGSLMEFDGSGSDTSDSETSSSVRRKKLKT